METLKCIKTRRSVRNFKEKPVPEETLKRIIEAGTYAPSAGNTQDWVFVVVRDSETKRLLSSAALNQWFIAKAPVVIVVCSDLEKISRRYGERGKSLYSIQDTAAAIQNMLLAAWDLGLGTCWVGAFDEERIKEILGLPAGVRPVAIIPAGYPKEVPEKTERQEPEIHYEKW